MKAYQLGPNGAPYRLAVLRAAALASGNNPNPQTRLAPHDWKGARRYSMGSYESAYGTLSPGRGQWYSHAGESFRNERDASPHGWHTDSEYRETAVGIIANLTHGRFLAGYRWTDNDERVYFPDVFSSETEAGKMADEHARVFAESAFEDNQRFDAMQQDEYALDKATNALQDCRALRRTGRRVTEDVIESIQSLRDALAEATAAYERGA